MLSLGYRLSIHVDTLICKFVYHTHLMSRKQAWAGERCLRFISNRNILSSPTPRKKKLSLDEKRSKNWNLEISTIKRFYQKETNKSDWEDINKKNKKSKKSLVF